MAKELELNISVNLIEHPRPKSAIDLIANLVLKNALKDDSFLLKGGDCSKKTETIGTYVSKEVTA